jgi:type I restriction enzyme, S subunit
MADLPSNWRIARFDEFLKKVDRKFLISDDDIYRCVGVRWYGLGAFVREELPGMDISRKQQWIIKAGDIVYNKLFAWKNSFAIADDAVDGCIVSDKFPTYEADLSLVDLKFLEYYFRVPKIGQQAQDLSKGAAAISKLTLNPPQFWELTMPLPPLDEQRRLVARIEALAAKIEEARGLRRLAVEEAENLVVRAASQILDEQGWQIQRLETVLAEPPRNGLSPQQEVESNGRRMLRINAVSSSPTRYVDLSAYKLVDVVDEIAQPFVLQHDDVFIVRYNGDINRVAKAAIFRNDGECDVVYPDKLMRLRPDKSKMIPDFLVFALGASSVRSQIEEMGKTTAGQIGVSGSNAKSFQVPVPPLEEQRRIVAYLDGLQAKVDALKQLQAQTQAELDALLPSVLDRAFRGEL